jgi:hypothetical protein
MISVLTIIVYFLFPRLNADYMTEYYLVRNRPDVVCFDNAKRLSSLIKASGGEPLIVAYKESLGARGPKLHAVVVCNGYWYDPTFDRVYYYGDEYPKEILATYDL